MKIFVKFILLFIFESFITNLNSFCNNNEWMNQDAAFNNLSEIFTTPDDLFIYVNCNNDHFLKVDTKNGNIVDSVIGKGIIAGFSWDKNFIFTRKSNFENLYKLDIHTYEVLDSIDNFQDIKAPNSKTPGINGHFMGICVLYGKIYVTVYQGKYKLIILDANSLEIIDKIPAYGYEYGAGKIALSENYNHFIAIDQYYLNDSIPNSLVKYNKIYFWGFDSLKQVKMIFDRGGDSLYYMKFSWDGAYNFAFNYNNVIYNYDTYHLCQLDSFPGVGRFDWHLHFPFLFIYQYNGYVNLKNFYTFENDCIVKLPDSVHLVDIKFSINSPEYFYGGTSGTIYKFKDTWIESDVSLTSKLIRESIIPNPASNKIKVKFSISIAGKTNLVLSDALGIQRGNLFEGNLEHGSNELSIDLPDVPNGVYFVTIISNSYHLTQKLLIIK